MKILFLFYILSLTFGKSHGLEVQFLKDFYKSKYINQIVWFGCYTNSEILSFVKHLSESYIRVAYFDVSDNVSMKETLKLNYYKIGVILNYDCSESEMVFDKFSKEDLAYNESYNWLVLTRDKLHVERSMINLPLNVATECTIATEIGNRISLFEVYNPSHKHNGNINITHMGAWDMNSGLNYFSTEYKYVRRANLHGLTLNFSVVTNNLPSDVSLDNYLRIPKKKHLDTMIRNNYGLLLQLKDLFNFTINLQTSTTWGYLVNGTFNGIIGDMINGITDVSVAPLMIRPERLDVLDYTVQSYVLRTSIFLKHPKKNSIRNVFLTPFTEKAWFAVLGAGLIYWIALLIIVCIEKKHTDNQMSILYKSPLTNSMFTTIVSLTQQGVTDIPRLYAGRVMCLSLFVWSLLLFQFYSASIVGSLLAEQPKFINTLKDLTNSNLQVGIHEIAYAHNFFRMSTDPDVKKLERVKISPNERRKKANYFNITEGLKRVKAGGFAFYLDTASAYRIIQTTFTEDEICDLVEIQLHPPRDIGTALPKRSPFKKMFTYGLRKIIEGGMTKRLFRIWHHRKPICPEGYSSTPLPVHLKEFSPALFLLASGIAFSASILIAEILCNTKLFSNNKT